MKLFIRYQYVSLFIYPQRVFVPIYINKLKLVALLFPDSCFFLQNVLINMCEKCYQMDNGPKLLTLYVARVKYPAVMNIDSLEEKYLILDC